jgi:thioredoxin-related protein
MIRVVAVILCSTLSFVSGYSQEKGIQFDQTSSWSQIKERAKTENKYIFIDAFATWCGPCKAMDSKVYTDPAVAKLFNDKFINVKVQFDQTAFDNDYVKSWYNDVKQLSSQYTIKGYPSFLFFSPDGELVYRDIGYHEAGDFVSIGNKATDPKEQALLKDNEYQEKQNAQKLAQAAANYRNGKKDYNILGETARELKKQKEFRTVADSMAKDYKKNVLDKMSQDQLLNPQHLGFIGDFFNLINSSDNFFKICYNKGAEADKIMNYPGWADFQVSQTISREELENKLVKDKKPMVKNPDWKKLQSTIASKYKKVDARKIVISYQIMYYQAIDKDMPRFAKLYTEKVKLYPPSSEGMAPFMELNAPAWSMFLSSNDKTVLENALIWVTKSIEMSKDEPLQQLDTKAAILYKLGKKEEAIATETEALEISKKLAIKEGKPEEQGPFYSDYFKAIELMKKDMPIYEDQGAIWPK